MTAFSRRCIALLAPAGLLALSACINIPDHAKIPDAIAAPANLPIALEAMATGVQVYDCRAGAQAPGHFQWTFKAPEAELYRTAGNLIGHHGAGPTWTGTDGSSVVGQLTAQVPDPDGKAIPWLLLTAKSNGGKGMFARTAYIQRVNTTGGKAPAGGCDAAHAGKQVRVPYTATYYFYDAKQ